MVSANITSANTSRGIYLNSTGDSTLTGTVSGNTATGHGIQGIYLISQQNDVMTHLQGREAGQN